MILNCLFLGSKVHRNESKFHKYWNNEIKNWWWFIQNKFEVRNFFSFKYFGVRNVIFAVLLAWVELLNISKIMKYYSQIYRNIQGLY